MNYKNIEGTNLEICSTNPMTGYNRDGKCRPDNQDGGKHLVCAKLDKNFLEFTNNDGNNLHSLKEGDNWCLCEDRYYKAHLAGKAPEVIKEATYSRGEDHIKQAIMGGGSRQLPKLRKINKSKKKYLYHLNDKQSKRILAINEDLNKIKSKRKRKHAASQKKKRFNVLRLYRKYRDKKGCKKLTKDMKYLDKKYGLGKTKKIC